MRPFVKAALASLAVLTASASTAALAQPAPPADQNGYGRGEGRSEARAEARSGDWRERGREMMARKHQERAAELHTILAIQPGQEAAFAAFQQSMQWTPNERHDRRDEQRPMTTPQRLDQAQAWLEERTGRMRRRIEATRAFYAALNPNQQKVFDALHAMHDHHGWEGREDGHDGPGGMRHGGMGPHGMGPGGPPPGGPAEE